MNFKISIPAVLLAFAANTVQAAPSISGVSLSQASGSYLTTVEYTLENEPAIVTFDILTNRTGAATAEDSDWVSIGEQTLTNAFGDVNCLVAPGGRKIHWRADDTWAGHLIPAGAARAVVKAWSTNTPPDYLVVDLRSDEDREYSPEPRIRYFVSTNSLPHGGISSDAYRNEYIAMRRIPSQGVKWCMGSPEDEPQRSANETQHYVTFKKPDFYMAVFPLTIGQALNFGSLLTGDPWGIQDLKLPNGTWIYQYSLRYGTTNETPLNASDIYVMRGKPTEGALWQTNGYFVTETSLCGLMRARTGVDFDLPTEAQWEFAYRAGTSSAYHNGKSSNSSGPLDIGWTDANSGVDGELYLHRVGEKKPNAWGLYDMSGSVFEWCLDYYTSTMSADLVEDPGGPKTGTYFTLRGGCYRYSYTSARAAARVEGTGVPIQSGGARLVCPVSLKWP